MASFTASAKLSAVAASGTLFHVQAGTTKAITVLTARVTNGSNTTNDQIEIRCYRTTGASSGGTVVTPVSRESFTPQATARSGTIGGTTDVGTLEYAGVPSLGGFATGGVPEEYPVLLPSQGYMIELVDTPASPLDLIVQVNWLE